MNLLKKYPFFLLLFSLFFFLHGWAENYSSISFSEAFLVGLSVFVVNIILFVIFYFFTRKILYAALITFFVIVWYFFFGAIHDFIKSTILLYPIKRYSVFLPLVLLATIFWIIYLKKRERHWQKFSLYLNMLFITFCLIDLLKLGYNAAAKSKTVHTIKFNYAAVRSKPDVFLLLFDEYPSYKSLKDSFGFENKEMENFLTKNSFKSLPIHSNYELTVFSMAAMFNMNYVANGYNPNAVSQKDEQQRFNEIKNGEVFNIFKKMGYKIENNSIFDIQNAPGVSGENSFLLGHGFLLTDKIFLNRLNKDVGWSFPLWLVKLLPFLRHQTEYSHRDDNLITEKKALSLPDKSSKSPIFLYTHLLLPHGPYYYDSAGTEIPFQVFNQPNSWNNRQNFISYLKYTNKIAERLITKIQSTKPHAIIIFMSDHGFRFYNDEKTFQEAFFENMCYINFPDKNYGSFSQPITNVNFFSYLFNNQFGQEIRYLKDTSLAVFY